jgi:carbon storage regulator CsrA
MLILTRRKNEDVVIEHNGVIVANIRIIDVGHGKVRLGFEAPKTTVVTRRELMRPKKRNKNGVE